MSDLPTSQLREKINDLPPDDAIRAERSERGDRDAGGDEHIDLCDSSGCPCYREGQRDVLATIAERVEELRDEWCLDVVGRRAFLALLSELRPSSPEGSDQ